MSTYSLDLTADNLRNLPSPAFLISEKKVRDNLHHLARVKQATGCTILLALKGFACFHLFPLVAHFLDGGAASSVNEALLAKTLNGQVHAYAPAYSEKDLIEIAPLCDHLVFNSLTQLERFRNTVRRVAPNIRIGIRINPEHSETDTPLYDPCAPGSRLGVRRRDLDPAVLDGVTGIHFHTLCEKDAIHLTRTIAAVEDRFGDVLHRMEWCNMGGGHLISKQGYDHELLTHEINRIQDTYGLQVILEPGAAVALDAGLLVTTILDIVPGDPPTAIMDCSVAAHMPDVLEMPYRPRVWNAGRPGDKPCAYRLGGISCLAGDVAGIYSFDAPLSPGDQLYFEDMAHYTMVKTTMFNGVRHPAIALLREDGTIDTVRRFTYDDYRGRMG